MEINKIEFVKGRVRRGLPELLTCSDAFGGVVLSMSHAANGFGPAGDVNDSFVVDPTHPTPSGRPGSPPV